MLPFDEFAFDIALPIPLTESTLESHGLTPEPIPSPIPGMSTASHDFAYDLSNHSSSESTGPKGVNPETASCPLSRTDRLKTAPMKTKLLKVSADSTLPSILGPCENGTCRNSLTRVTVPSIRLRDYVCTTVTLQPMSDSSSMGTGISYPIQAHLSFF
ncbi:hypothetical protein NE237_032940 [Protea cynaroides]|uniref:Uncharacterized protein n=1 Tax=Protea cynaroides TaxID=273540 RepID=A0A9Q0L3Y5_9MAGN|nr:hypothetical protein NE237_032940 [Protea cynaroides]